MPVRDYTRFEDNLLDLVSPQTLLLLDRGFYHFQFWQQYYPNKQKRKNLYRVRKIHNFLQARGLLRINYCWSGNSNQRNI